MQIDTSPCSGSPPSGTFPRYRKLLSNRITSVLGDERQGHWAWLAEEGMARPFQNLSLFAACPDPVLWDYRDNAAPNGSTEEMVLNAEPVWYIGASDHNVVWILNEWDEYAAINLEAVSHCEVKALTSTRLRTTSLHVDITVNLRGRGPWAKIRLSGR